MREDAEKGRASERACIRIGADVCEKGRQKK